MVLTKKSENGFELPVMTNLQKIPPFTRLVVYIPPNRPQSTITLPMAKKTPAEPSSAHEKAQPKVATTRSSASVLKQW